MSSNGRFVAVRERELVQIVDALGPSPRTSRPGATHALAWIGDELWTINAAGELEGTSRVTLPSGLSAIVEGTDSAIVEAPEQAWLVDARETFELPAARYLAIAGRRIVVAEDRHLVLRTARRDDGLRFDVGKTPLAAAFVLGGRAIAVHVEDGVSVFTSAGKLVHAIKVPGLVTCAFAEDANLAVGIAEHGITVLDLRLGAFRAACPVESVTELAIDRQARRLALATPRADGNLDVAHVTYDEMFARPAIAVSTEQVDQIVVEEAACEPVAPVVEAAPSEDAIVELPLALGSAPHVLPLSNETPKALPYADAASHLHALLDVVAARAALAIAEGWHTGRTSHDCEGDLPCEREVLGLLGESVGLAADALRTARQRLLERASELRDRTEASFIVGLALPFHELAQSYALSPTATQILACAAAPRLRSNIARLYGVLAGVTGRIACTNHLLEALVECDEDPAIAVARELAPDAPLVRLGLVMFSARAERMDLVVDGVVIDRLRGIRRAVEISEATTRRAATVELDAVIAPATLKRTLVRALAERDATPARIVVRGRRGSGRHTLIAALAARVGRDIAQVDITRLPKASLASGLALELVRADLSGCVPVVSGLEAVPRDDAEALRHVEAVLRRHSGPVVVRSAADVELPLAPERIDVTLPPLTLSQRSQAWRKLLSTHALTCDEELIGSLATRFRFGPGTIARVASEVARRARRDPDAVASLCDEVARQHIAGRLERVATRITRLPDWDQVTLIDDMRDSVRELIGRMRHQRTVFEDWGFDHRISTARGLTALFYGPPGTGKTLVAGLIGRELGLDVWRIDLARVTSKWVGETEKSLAEVFEAAEEGQVLLLFDEADSLFGKRSEVKSSNDRYANLETNYLLQRFDSFEGVAILTTNLEGSIDPAFKRRLSMRLYFPFPDEEIREQLWAAHVPPGVPSTGHLDFADLARRYPLSGGYIRNSALRAAFLAAQERRPLSQQHLVRAVELEYRELGKLSSTGRID
jgi:hypothetical protein